MLPATFRSGKRSQQTGFALASILAAVTDVAVTAKFLHVVNKSRPPIIPSDVGEGAILTRMSNRNIIVKMFHELRAQITKVRNKDAISVHHQFFTLFTLQ